jgi:hypothetical protein
MGRTKFFQVFVDLDSLFDLALSTYVDFESDIAMVTALHQLKFSPGELAFQYIIGHDKAILWNILHSQACLKPDILS